MEAGLEACLTQLRSIEQDLPGLGNLDRTRFNWQPSPNAWSVGQCIEHLNITIERYLPVLRSAVQSARAQGLTAQGPFAIGWIERLFIRSMEPPPGWRFKTPKPFVAGVDLDPVATVARARQLRVEFGECIRSADGLNQPRIKVRSQFAPVSWTLNGTFALLLAHERRHLWQAREVRKHPAFPAGPAGPAAPARQA